MSDFLHKIIKEQVITREKRSFETIRESGEVNVQIPLCCREGWDSCPHVAKKQRKVKGNIGL